jgi:squalene synthase HpnC
MPSTPELEIARNLPRSGCTAEEARAYTRWLATHHYENFNVASWLLPKRLHQHFYNVYAYCRWADDLGDEIPDREVALKLLDAWDEELQGMYRGSAAHPVFVALAGTVRELDIPIDPFRDLLIAFRQDQTIHRYEDWAGVLEYCRYSANPVGRLVLYLAGYRDAERQALSDATCTALQLANFWQDVDRDLEMDRIYIPLDLLRANGLGPDDLFARRFDDRYAQVMKELMARTRVLFAQGAPLAGMLTPDLRVDIELFSRGGLAVLDGIEAVGYDTLHRRPAVSRVAQMKLLARAVLGRCLAWILPSKSSAAKRAPVNDAKANGSLANEADASDARSKGSRSNGTHANGANGELASVPGGAEADPAAAGAADRQAKVAGPHA